MIQYNVIVDGEHKGAIIKEFPGVFPDWTLGVNYIHYNLVSTLEDCKQLAIDEANGEVKFEAMEIKNQEFKKKEKEISDRTVQIPFKLYDKLTSFAFTMEGLLYNPTELREAEFDDGTSNPMTTVVYFTNKDFELIKELAQMIRDERS